jgi:hypothetical protein
LISTFDLQNNHDRSLSEYRKKKALEMQVTRRQDVSAVRKRRQRRRKANNTKPRLGPKMKLAKKMAMEIIRSRSSWPSFVSPCQHQPALPALEANRGSNKEADIDKCDEVDGEYVDSIARGDSAWDETASSDIKPLLPPVIPETAMKIKPDQGDDDLQVIFMRSSNWHALLVQDSSTGKKRYIITRNPEADCCIDPPTPTNTTDSGQG